MDRPMIMIGGKGGVGKTTCSAAIAARSAAQGIRTLIITSDMTPSLTDIFEQNIGSTIREVDKDLYAIEIGADTITERWKAKFAPDFYDIISRLIDVKELDNETEHQLIDYIGSAPSLREETMLDIIHELVEQKIYDRVIWDTAPAGETLTLLSMPSRLKQHIRAGARIYQGLDNIGRHITGKRSIAEIMNRWADLSDILSRFIQHSAAFILVTTPESLVVQQAYRLLRSLEDHHIHLHGLIINRLIAGTDSPQLSSLRNVQQNHACEIHRMAASLPVAELPFSLKDLRGIEALRDCGTILNNALHL